MIEGKGGYRGNDFRDLTRNYLADNSEGMRQIISEFLNESMKEETG